MKSSLRRRLLSLHRLLGAASAGFLVVLAITGLLLNHNVSLGLDQVFIRSPWLLRHYGLLDKTDTIQSYQTKSGIVSIFHDHLYFEGQPVEPVGGFTGAAAVDDSILLVAAPEKVILVEIQSAALVDTIEAPPETKTHLEKSGHAFAVGLNGAFRLDDALADWEPLKQEAPPMRLPPETDTPVALRDSIFQSHAGTGLSLYRVLLDLHAGRILHLPGVLLMDLAAVAVLYLVFSGLLTWRTGRRRRSRPTEEPSEELN